MAEKLWLNLGCSDNLLKEYVNVDCHQFKPSEFLEYLCLKWDLRQQWFWDDSSVDFILAKDIIEHLPDKIHTMNEMFRVLKPNGIVHIEVPTTEGRGAFQDPTHVSFWNRNSFFYYTHGDPHRERLGKDYGISARFEVMREDTVRLPDDVVKLTILLRAVKENSDGNKCPAPME